MRVMKGGLTDLKPYYLQKRKGMKKRKKDGKLEKMEKGGKRS